MSQEKVLDLLKKNKLMSVKEIAEILRLNQRGILIQLSQLYKFGEIERIEVKLEDCKNYNLSPRGRKHFLWKSKNGKGNN